MDKTSLHFRIDYTLDPETSYEDLRRAIQFLLTTLPEGPEDILPADQIPRWSIRKISGCTGSWYVAK